MSFSNTVGARKLPVINIGPLMSPNPDPAALATTMVELKEACLEWGLFYAIGHGIDPQFISTVMALTREFFGQPKEFKRSVGKTKLNFRGYGDRYTPNPEHEYNEVYDYTWDGAPPTNGLTQLDAYGQNRWPSGMPEFKENMKEFYEVAQGICTQLIKAVFSTISVSQEEALSFFTGFHDHSFVHLNYYPACPDLELHLGQNPHTDACALTLLLMDENVSALQIMADGTFMNVPPVEGSFVIQVGEMIQVWSNDVYKAPVHRVLANGSQERVSVVFQFEPSSDCQVKPLPTCISKDNPVKYNTFELGEFMAYMHEENASGIAEPYFFLKYRKGPEGTDVEKVMGKT